MNTRVLETLLSLSSENEVVEFKEAKNNYDLTKLGKYFSLKASKFSYPISSLTAVYIGFKS